MLSQQLKLSGKNACTCSGSAALNKDLINVAADNGELLRFPKIMIVLLIIPVPSFF